ncbi:L,D-transpeptidase family protein [Microbacterium karelineae]|uniref:L,D-transpeptidase family protein n=1 Tax=Microbacterium karelineae TaxID=2654283 RepID=UPI0012EAAD62|nr:L,D-transpeptidase [Microbacterium karelineae]
MTRGWAWIAGAAAAVVVLGVVIAALVWPRGETLAEPTPTPTPTVSATPTPTPSPTPTGPPANEAEYSADGLPTVDVHAVIPELPVDDAPDDPTLGLTAAPRGEGAPVFADPTEEPVAWLLPEQRYGGTAVPIVEEHEHWAKVLLVGRQAVAGDGDPSQLTGWVRTADIGIAPNDTRIEVDLAARTIDIVAADGDDETRETIATDFGFGTEATPTPLGRSFIMLTEQVSFEYTRGHEMVYLSVQSPTLAGFGGQPVAVTAFHYHDARSGAISNGCIRLPAEAIDRLAELPAGTPVHVSA